MGAGENPVYRGVGRASARGRGGPLYRGRVAHYTGGREIQCKEGKGDPVHRGEGRSSAQGGVRSRAWGWEEDSPQ